jgi:Pvc16 N-terminal domain
VSNSRAISAVTSTIRFLLERAVQADPELASTVVTTKPPGTARGNNRGKQLNIFLYEVRPNAAFWNGDPRAAPGGFTPLALNLYFLLTAYADDLDNEDAVSQQILGRALSTLHDHPLLGAVEIQNALPGSELENQIERVRITFQLLSNEDIWKLWSAFQTPFRLSAAYEASVVLIESTRAAPAALPVLRRGSDDRGVQTLASPAPSLDRVAPVATPARPVAQLGDDLLVTGQGLDSSGALVRLVGPADIPIQALAPQPGGTPTELRVHLPSPAEDPDLSRFAPGVYRLMLVVGGSGQPQWTTNEVPFGLAPVVTVAPLSAPAGDLQLTVTCRPRLRTGQRVLLLLGARQVQPETLTTPADPAQPSTIVFTAAAVAPGSYVVRLRVDGVDSLPIVATGTPPRLSFDPAQTVTVT